MSRFFIDKSALSYRIRARAEDRNWRGPFAEVAELVDALGSGPSGGNTVGVRVPSSAPSSARQDSNLSARRPAPGRESPTSKRRPNPESGNLRALRSETEGQVELENPPSITITSPVT